jgi:hypothetical protein
MARTIAGQFPERRMAERAIAELRSAGFDPNRKSIVEMEREAMGPLPGDAVKRFTGGSLLGIVIGAVVGAIVGLIVAALVAGSGRWTLVAAIVCAVAGACIGWLVVGSGASGVPIEEAEYRRERIEQGRVLLTMDAQGRDAEAREIMRRSGARGVESDAADGRTAPSPDFRQGASM